MQSGREQDLRVVVGPTTVFCCPFLRAACCRAQRMARVTQVIEIGVKTSDGNSSLSLVFRRRGGGKCWNILSRLCRGSSVLVRIIGERILEELRQINFSGFASKRSTTKSHLYVSTVVVASPIHRILPSGASSEAVIERVQGL